MSLEVKRYESMPKWDRLEVKNDSKKLTVEQFKKTTHIEIKEINGSEITKFQLTKSELNELISFLQEMAK